MTWQSQHGGHIVHLHVDLLRQQFAQIRAVCDLRKARRTTGCPVGGDGFRAKRVLRRRRREYLRGSGCRMLSRGIQTDATSCETRYGRHSRRQRRAPWRWRPALRDHIRGWSRVDASSDTLCGSSCRSGIHDRRCCGFCKLAGERPAMRVRPQQVLGSGRGLSVAHVVRRSPSNAHAVRVQA
jgi:hypothetical protein